MIIDVPDHEELRDTATGWMCLAWEIIIEAIDDYRSLKSYYTNDGTYELDDDMEIMLVQYWTNNRFKLNNAISLTQQSLEMFLKA